MSRASAGRVQGSPTPTRRSPVREHRARSGSGMGAHRREGGARPSGNLRSGTGSPPDEPGSLRSLALLYLFASCALLVLHRLEGAIPPLPPFADAWRFVVETDPLVGCFSLLRVVAIVLGYYILTTATLGLIARALRLATLARAIDLVSLPLVRRALRGMAGASLAASVTATGLAAAGAPLVVLPAVAAAEPTAGPSTTTPSTEPTMRLLGESNDPQNPDSVSSSGSASTDRGMTMRLLDPSEPGPAGNTGPGQSTPVPAPPPGAGTVQPGSDDAPTMRVADGADRSDATTSPEANQASRRGDAATPSPSGHGDQPSPAHSGGEGSAADTPEQPEKPSNEPDTGHDAGTSVGMPRQPSVPTSWTIASGDHLWRVAGMTLWARAGQPPTDAQTATYLQRLIQHNRSVLAVPDDPDLVFPGQVFELPPT